MNSAKFLPVRPFLDEPAFFCDVLDRSSFGSLCRKACNSEDVRLEKKEKRHIRNHHYIITSYHLLRKRCYEIKLIFFV
jgi:hypothetical protein